MTDQDRCIAAPVTPYKTKDGSEIREFWHPDHQGHTGLSLAQATVAAGTGTRRHRHRQTEEVYHIQSGKGVMERGLERFAIHAGDTIGIAPGVAHRVFADQDAALVILCCCVPPYRHDDTEIL